MSAKSNFLLFFFLMINFSIIASFSQEYMDKICERGITIYPNETSCGENIYFIMEKTRSEELQTISTIITILAILCLAGIFTFVYKKFFQKQK